MSLEVNSERVLAGYSQSRAALFLAIQQQDATGVTMALAEGANPSVERGRAIVLACAAADTNARRDMVATLLSAGGTDRATQGAALSCATLQNDESLVRQLLRAGAEAGSSRNRAIRLAVERDFVDVAEALLAAGADLHDAPTNQLTAFELAFCSKFGARALPWALSKKRL